ncbi:TRAP transporter substrate-binding protein, partial [Corallococcus exiguus]|uniref:hypothetical protein n=1 Tax=Corallococcus exiguus TaxID=83462 RepID=UPI00181AA111
PEEQTILTECSIVGRDEQRRVSRDLNDKSLAKLKAQGMQVSEVSPAELTKMREATAAVYERHQATIGPETIAKLDEALKQVRSK